MTNIFYRYKTVDPYEELSRLATQNFTRKAEVKREKRCAQRRTLNPTKPSFNAPHRNHLNVVIGLDKWKKKNNGKASLKKNVVHYTIPLDIHVSLLRKF